MCAGIFFHSANGNDEPDQNIHNCAKEMQHFKGKNTTVLLLLLSLLLLLLLLPPPPPTTTTTTAQVIAVDDVNLFWQD